MLRIKIEKKKTKLTNKQTKKDVPWIFIEYRLPFLTRYDTRVDLNGTTQMKNHLPTQLRVQNVAYRTGWTSATAVRTQAWLGGGLGHGTLTGKEGLWGSLMQLAMPVKEQSIPPLWNSVTGLWDGAVGMQIQHVNFSKMLKYTQERITFSL